MNFSIKKFCVLLLSIGVLLSGLKVRCKMLSAREEARTGTFTIAGTYPSESVLSTVARLGRPSSDNPNLLTWKGRSRVLYNADDIVVQVEGEAVAWSSHRLLCGTWVEVAKLYLELDYDGVCSNGYLLVSRLADSRGNRLHLKIVPHGAWGYEMIDSIYVRAPSSKVLPDTRPLKERFIDWDNKVWR